MASKGNKSYIWWLVALLIGSFLVISLFSVSPPEGCVGIVEIKGPIIYDDVRASLFFDEIRGAKSIAQDIMSANERKDVKAVLVLIDSPGGSVVASTEIYDALSSLNKTKVAHINEIGTSGAYLIATATDYIIANPNAITGSIGARMSFADMSRLFEKIGYNETVIKTGEMKDIGSPARPMSKEEYGVLYSLLNESFSQFVEAIRKGRGERLNEVLFEQVLDARILSGRQAKNVGLVDELGKRDDALRKAGELAGLKGEPRECMLSSTIKRRSMFGSLVSQLEYYVKSKSLPQLSYS
ncbi:MAG: signal peptide peptidase SppA [Candidatus Anstonellaceae archaeon]